MSGFKAEPRHWADVEEWVAADSQCSTDHCILELRQQVESLKTQILALREEHLRLINAASSFLGNLISESSKEEEVIPFVW